MSSRAHAYVQKEKDKKGEGNIVSDLLNLKFEVAVFTI
jgi:hypothetical protein